MEVVMLVKDPPSDLYLTPHSCGEPCGRQLNKDHHVGNHDDNDRDDGHCRHHCVIQCHPGPCQPCKAFAPPMICPCGHANVENDGIFSCNSSCGKPLGCGNHVCRNMSSRSWLRGRTVRLTVECFNTTTTMTDEFNVIHLVAKKECGRQRCKCVTSDAPYLIPRTVPPPRIFNFLHSSSGYTALILSIPMFGSSTMWLIVLTQLSLWRLFNMFSSNTKRMHWGTCYSQKHTMRFKRYPIWWVPFGVKDLCGQLCGAPGDRLAHSNNRYLFIVMLLWWTALKLVIMWILCRHEIALEPLEWSTYYTSDPKWVIVSGERCKNVGSREVVRSGGTIKVYFFCPMLKKKRDAVRLIADRWKLSIRAAGWEQKWFIAVQVTLKSKAPSRILGTKGLNPLNLIHPPSFDPLVDVDPRLVVALFDLPGDVDVSALVLRFGG
ncbi:NF-X1-type zinc finger protein NFXL1 [Tanacetum coccineum]